MPQAARPLDATVAALALLAGVLPVQWLPRLPPLGLALPALLAAAWLLRRSRLGLQFCLLGCGLALWHGAAGMEARLPRALEGRDVTVAGTVRDLPDTHADAVRFAFDVREATLDGADVPLRGRVSVAWYGARSAPAPCGDWELVLRLRRPRALLNPGTADAERTALERGVHATGYVRRAVRSAGRRPCVDRVRASIARAIDARVKDTHDAALLRALAVGDTRALTAEDWSIARATGVSHLIAISGFHVGVAALFGVGVVWLLYALLPALALRLPRQQAQAGAALMVATAYSALAGFGLPTVRTLLMIAIVVCAQLSRRGRRNVQALALALLGILLADPLAVLSAGFWLSFAGVAFLMLCLGATGRGWRAFLRELASGQALMTVSLLPLTFWFFGQASLVGGIANLLAVPFVSFVIVPAALGSTLLLALCPPAAAPAWWLTAQLMHAQWRVLAGLAAWPGAQWYLPTVSATALALALAGAVWLFAPREVPQRWLGALLFLPLLLPARTGLPAGGFQAVVLDVGQGLAVAVRTRGHALVYDAGARYPSGFDVGAAVVVPALRALGLDHVDLLMVSHADNDHAGGAAAVAAAFPAALRYAGEPSRLPWPARPCAAGQRWSWDGVRFEVLNPPAWADEEKGNDRSCVLLVTGAGGRLLLTGDISARRELAVAGQVGPGERPVLLVPHHGSRGASSAAFIAALRPRLAVVSAGFRNRYGHPRPEVVARYADASVPLLNTATLGAIALEFPPSGPPGAAAGWRFRARRYWRE